jgi:predicted dithiol-disulfide oxidoreductase (DUF899 family)
LRDQLSAERRALPWVKVEKEYVFDTPGGKVTLADLFEGRSQLVIKHFMLGPEWKEGCVGCSFEVDHIEGALVHRRNNSRRGRCIGGHDHDEIYPGPVQNRGA